MPIADFEKAILRLLAANRNPESFVAGATVLLRGETSHRRSQDIDQASRKRFADWGEANNHRQVGGAISEFYELFVAHSSYYGRLRWVGGKRPIYYRQTQLGNDICDRILGRTPYGRMFSKLAKHRRD